MARQDHWRRFIGVWPVIAFTLIHVNADDDRTQQRQTVAHEFKHIIDHSRDVTAPYVVPPHLTLEDLEERFAGYSVRCVMLPKKHVVQQFAARRQTAEEIAALFDTPIRMAHLRLVELCLTTGDNYPLNSAAKVRPIAWPRTLQRILRMFI